MELAEIERVNTLKRFVREATGSARLKNGSEFKVNRDSEEKK